MTRSSIRLRDSSSMGFGGTWPAGMKSTPSRTSFWSTASKSRSLSTSRLERPAVRCFMPNQLEMDRLRRSVSTMTTFLAASARQAAIFLEMKDLPAPELKEVVIRTGEGQPSGLVKSMLVHIMRIASLNTRVVLLYSISSLSGFFLRVFLEMEVAGMSARNGRSPALMMSLRLRILLSVATMTTRMSAGTNRPMRKATSNILFRSGSLGLPLPSAESIIRALLSTMAWVRAFSSRLFRRKMYRLSLIFCWRSKDSRWRALAGSVVNWRRDSRSRLASSDFCTPMGDLRVAM